MRDIAFAYPGDLDTPTGGYRYDRAVIGALEARGHAVARVALAPDFPFPAEASVADAAARLAAVPRDTVLIVDGLAFGALPAAALAPVAAPIVALVHHPLALETGLAAADAARLAASERAALAFARAVVVTSPATARTVEADFGVAAGRLTVALPGLDPRWSRLARRPAAPPRIVSVGSLSPRKGHDVLVDAVASLGDLKVRCDIVGGVTDPQVADALAAQIAAHGLGDRVTLHGALETDAIAALYEAASVFALATRYEGFGMVFAEAMAAGLPVVGTTGGAVPDVVPATAGILVAPDDLPGFAAALRSVLVDEARRARLAEGARAAGAGFGGWERTAATISDLVEALA